MTHKAWFVHFARFPSDWLGKCQSHVGILKIVETNMKTSVQQDRQNIPNMPSKLHNQNTLHICSTQQTSPSFILHALPFLHLLQIYCCIIWLGECQSAAVHRWKPTPNILWCASLFSLGEASWWKTGTNPFEMRANTARNLMWLPGMQQGWPSFLLQTANCQLCLVVHRHKLLGPWVEWWKFKLAASCICRISRWMKMWEKVFHYHNEQHMCEVC